MLSRSSVRISADFGTYIPGFFQPTCHDSSVNTSIRNVSIVFLLTYPLSFTNVFCNSKLDSWTMSESILCAKCGYTVANDIELPTIPVPDLLGGHYIPSEFQAKMICDTISTAQADISRLDDEITRLNGVLDGLTRKRDALQTYTRLHTALVAPIRRLPPEVLSEIFLHYNDENNISNFRLNTAPLQLGGVCSRWRTIALSTPWLWNSFALTIRLKYFKSDAMLAETWLARAGRSPLTIYLASAGNSQNTMEPLMEVFLLHCEQWYDIHISAPLSVLELLTPAKNRLPRLQRLSLNVHLYKPLGIFECAPRLRWLKLGSFFDPPMIHVPWNQIEYFDMGTREIDHTLELLRATPNLKECVINLNSSEPRRSHPSVQLLHLHSMTISGNPTYFFHTLLLPKLQEISIDSCQTQWTATSQLISLLSRCSLAKLSLGNPLSDNDIIQILQACPSLVQLDLYHQHISTSFLTQFTYRRVPKNSTTQQLVPMLRTMNIDYRGTGFDIFDFADAIQSRIISNSEDLASDNIAGLQTVKIHYKSTSHSPDSAILSRLRQLRGTGLDISLLLESEDIL